MDLFCYLSAIVFMLMIWKGEALTLFDVNQHFKAFLLLYPIWMTLFTIENFYEERALAKRELLTSIARITVMGTLLCALSFYLFALFGITPKSNLIIFSAIYFALIFLWRYFYLKIIKGSNWQIRTLLLSSEISNSFINNEIQDSRLLGYRIITLPGDDRPYDFIKKNLKKIDLIVLDHDMTAENLFQESLYQLIANNIRLMETTDFIETLTQKVSIKNLRAQWFLSLGANRFQAAYRIVKSVTDRIFAILILFMIAPLFFPLLIFLYLTSGRPIFFRQKRIGLFNQEFKLIKLRTMIIDAEKDGARWAQPGDNRITPIGMFLRKTRLDEIPQLWNVIKGEMSLVGPRPERPEFVSQLQKNIPFYNERHLTKPGLTGWAQIRFRYGYSENDAIEKLQYDLYYIKHQSLFFDLLILLKTVKTVLTGAGH